MFRAFVRSLAATALLSLIAAFAPPARAQATFDLLKKAQPDEFFTGIGNAYYPLGQQPPGTAGQPKVNYDYIWGMDADNRYVWFGTAANVGAYSAAAFGLIIPTEFSSPQKDIPYRVWEFAQSKYPRGNSFAQRILGDWRPPKIYRYDTITRVLHDLTPNDPMINQVVGIRSLGITPSGQVICGGPGFDQSSIVLFAFDQSSGQFLGSTQLRSYSNIRKWIRYQGVLYTSVERTFPIPSRGAVLRWVGTAASPFQFEEVGQVDNDGAYIEQHEGRLIVGTWVSGNAVTAVLNVPAPIAGLWMSPTIPIGGLRLQHARQWSKVWSADAYEADPVIALSYSMGSLVSFGGYLYFGTMHFPGLAMSKLRDAYNIPLTQQNFANSNRACLMLRAKNFGDAGPTVELLYGDAKVPVYTPGRLGGSGTWSGQLNHFGAGGAYGPSGFGDSTNEYIWSGAVHNGRLIFGTFDEGTDFGLLLDGANLPLVGADVYAFPNTSSPAAPLSRNGLGNPANHGIRNMVSTPTGLYLGTANGMNLLTDPHDNLPDGGWELRRLAE
jgi:hypothetical protein